MKGNYTLGEVRTVIKIVGDFVGHGRGVPYTVGGLITWLANIQEGLIKESEEELAMKIKGGLESFKRE